MSDILVIIFFAVAVGAADTIVGFQNLANANGYGCVKDVIERRAENPMQNRVLIPVLLTPFSDENRVRIYVIIKCLGIQAAALTMYPLAGLLGSMMLLTAIGGAIIFDYADHGWELTFIHVMFLTVFGLSTAWLIPVIVAWALMRESAVFGPIILFCGGMLIWAAIALSVVGIVRWGVRRTWGNPANYTVHLAGSVFPLRMNLKECREALAETKYAMIGMPVVGSLALLVFSVALAFTSARILAAPLAAMLGAAILYGKWNETRVFLNALSPAIIGFCMMRSNAM